MKKITALILCSLLMLTCASCFGGAGKGSLNIAVGSIEWINPLFEKNELDGLLFEGLLKDSAEGYVPALAESCVSQDYKTFTITLLKGAKFSNGAPVKAEDVLFSYNVVADASYDGEMGEYAASIEGYEDMRSGAAQSLKGISIAEDGTIKIIFASAARANLKYLTLPVVSEAYYAGTYTPGDVSAAAKVDIPMGSGAYAIADYENDKLTLKVNGNYPGTRTLANRQIVICAVQAGDVQAQIESGKLDLAFIDTAQRITAQSPTDITQSATDAQSATDTAYEIPSSAQAIGGGSIYYAILNEGSAVLQNDSIKTTLLSAVKLNANEYMLSNREWVRADSFIDNADVAYPAADTSVYPETLRLLINYDAPGMKGYAQKLAAWLEDNGVLCTLTYVRADNVRLYTDEGGTKHGEWDMLLDAQETATDPAAVYTRLVQIQPTLGLGMETALSGEYSADSCKKAEASIAKSNSCMPFARSTVYVIASDTLTFPQGMTLEAAAMYAKEKDTK